MSFSLRQGYKQEPSSLQIESMNTSLRNRLWNVICDYLVKNDQVEVVAFALQGSSYLFFKEVWGNYLAQIVNDIPDTLTQAIKKLYSSYYRWAWNEVYDFLEFTLSYIWVNKNFLYAHYVLALNTILQNEMAGYTVINGLVAPIYNTQEVDEVGQAISGSEYAGIVGVSEHLKSALRFLSDKNNPTFGASVHESICAVEATCCAICGKPKVTLGVAIGELSEHISIHHSLVLGFEKIYGYTSDERSIRHGMEDESTVTFEDARYMYVACSAFVNYLIAKANSAGIKLKKKLDSK